MVRRQSERQCRAILSLAVVSVLIVLVAGHASSVAAQTLDIYFIDTEGGQATLYVAPSGESLLVDTGNPGPRDHERMMAAIRAAGLQRIDHVVITHYHTDHQGGLEALSQALPIRNYYDHGLLRSGAGERRRFHGEICGDSR